MDKMKWQLIILSVICASLIWLLTLTIIQMFIIDVVIGIIGIVVSAILSIIMIFLLWKQPILEAIDKVVKELSNKKVDDDT